PDDGLGAEQERRVTRRLTRRAVTHELDVDLETRSAPVDLVLLLERLLHRSAEDRVDLHQPFLALGAHVDLHPGLEGDGVDRRPAANPSDVVAGPGAVASERVGLAVEDRDGAAERVGGVRHPERAPRVPARPLEGDSVTPRPERLVDDAAVASTVDRDEGVDPRTALPEEVLHATQVTQPLLAHGPDEEHVARGLELRGLERA